MRSGGDNFWQAGPTGPCGPCSELYYDRGPEHRPAGVRPRRASATASSSTWNLVFLQYNMLEGGTLEPLPAPSVDTGAGLERVAALTEGVHSVYETDAFGDVIREIEGWTGTSYDAGGQQTRSLRVLADHGRSMTFLASDGIERSNEGRGYVLRRVIRRATCTAAVLGWTATSRPGCTSGSCRCCADTYRS